MVSFFGTDTSPSSACSSPTIIRKTVVLPDPFGPTRPTFSLGLSWNEASTKRTWRPYCLLIFENAITSFISGAVLRIRRLASAAKRVFRNAEFLGGVLQPLIGAGQMMRDVAAIAAGDLVDNFRDDDGELLRRILEPVCRAHERLFEVDRVVHHADQRQHVAVPDDVLDDPRAIARRNAVALNPSRLDVRRLDGEHRAVPAAGREALPCVRGVLGRMRPAVHPDHADDAGARGGSIDLVGDELLRVVVDDFRDAHVAAAASPVRGRSE